MPWVKLEKIHSAPSRVPDAAVCLLKAGTLAHAKLHIRIREVAFANVSNMSPGKVSVYFGTDGDAGAIRLVPDDNGLVHGRDKGRKGFFIYRVGHMKWLINENASSWRNVDLAVVDHEGRLAVEVRIPSDLMARSEPSASDVDRLAQELNGKLENMASEAHPGGAPAEPDSGVDADAAADDAIAADLEPPVELPPAPPPPAPPPPRPATAPVLSTSHDHLDPNLVPAVDVFTGPTGVTVDVANNKVEFDRRFVIVTARVARMAAALAALKHGLILPRDQIAKRIWRRPPPSYESVITNLIAEGGFALKNIGLTFKTTRGVGVNLDIL